MNSRLRKKNLSAVVAELLHEQIKDGRYQLNEQLPAEPELMREFGVGRSSIREAIGKLENAGVVWVRQGLGTFVASKNAMSEPLAKLLQSARETDVDEVRELLELKIAERAALNRTEEDIHNIKDMLEKRNRAADKNNFLRWLEDDISFHISVAAASKNPILTELYQAFAEQQLKRSIAETYLKKKSMHRLTASHHALLEAIVEKDLAKAVNAIQAMHEKTIKK